MYIVHIDHWKGIHYRHSGECPGNATCKEFQLKIAKLTGVFV